MHKSKSKEHTSLKNWEQAGARTGADRYDDQTRSEGKTQTLRNRRGTGEERGGRTRSTEEKHGGNNTTDRGRQRENIEDT